MVKIWLETFVKWQFVSALFFSSPSSNDSLFLSCQMELSDGTFFMIKHTPLPNGNHPILSPVCPMGVAANISLLRKLNSVQWWSSSAKKWWCPLCSWLSLWLAKRGSEWNWISQTLMKRPLLIRAKNRPATYFGQCNSLMTFLARSQGDALFSFLNVFTLCHIADLESVIILSGCNLL